MPASPIADASPYLVRARDIKPTLLVPPDRLKDGAIASQVAYGLESSLIIATRYPGYHSIPHMHDAEQLNWVLEGELWIFIGEGGFLARRGDFFRIPRNAVHWSWVQGEGPCTLVELHSPGLVADPWVKDTASALLAREEDASQARAVPTLWPDYPQAGAVERRVMAAEAASS